MTDRVGKHLNPSRRCALRRLVLLGGFVLLAACGSKAVKDAQRFVDVKEYDRAKELLDLELKTNPKNEAAYLLLGKVDLLLDQDVEAQKAFDTALLLDKDNAARIGAIYRDTGEQQYADLARASTADQRLDLDRVMADFTHATTYDPTTRASIRSWAVDDTRRRAMATRTAQPLLLFDRLLQLDPDGRTDAANLAMDLAKTYSDRHFDDEAANYAERAAKWDPKYLKPAAQLLRTAGLATKNLDYLRLAIKWDATLDDDDVAWVFVEQHARTPEEYLGTHHPAKHVVEARALIAQEAPPTPPPSVATAETPSTPYNPAADGVLAHWSFDSNGADISPVGTRSEWSPGGQTAPGKFRAGYRFTPGTYFALYSTMGFHFMRFTMAAWADITELTDNEALIGVGRDGGSASHAYLFVVSHANGTNIPGIAASIVNSSGTAVALPHVPMPDLLNHWHHFALMYTGTTVFLYVDGKLATSGPFTGSVTVDAATPLYINRHDFGSTFSSRLGGTVDDVALFNRALQADELRRLMTDANANGLPDFWEH